MASAEGTQSAAVATEEYVNKVADKTAGAAVKRYFTIPGRDAFEELPFELLERVAARDREVALDGRSRGLVSDFVHVLLGRYCCALGAFCRRHLPLLRLVAVRRLPRPSGGRADRLI